MVTCQEHIIARVCNSHLQVTGALRGTLPSSSSEMMIKLSGLELALNDFTYNTASSKEIPVRGASCKNTRTSEVSEEIGLEARSRSRSIKTQWSTVHGYVMQSTRRVRLHMQSCMLLRLCTLQHTCIFGVFMSCSKATPSFSFSIIFMNVEL